MNHRGFRRPATGNVDEREMSQATGDHYGFRSRGNHVDQQQENLQYRVWSDGINKEEEDESQWMKSNEDKDEDLKFWNETNPDNKFRCYSSSELSPFSEMDSYSSVAKIQQEISAFQQIEEEGILGLRGLRKMSESLEEENDGVYDKKVIAEMYEDDELNGINIRNNIEHLLKDEESGEANTDTFDESHKIQNYLPKALDIGKLDMPKEWKSPFPSDIPEEWKCPFPSDMPEEWKTPFPSPPVLETDENGQTFHFSPHTSHTLQDSPLAYDPSYTHTPSPNLYKSQLFKSNPSCFDSPAPSPQTLNYIYPQNTSGFSQNMSGCSQNTSGYSSPMTDQNYPYVPPSPLSYVDTNGRTQLNDAMNIFPPPRSWYPDTDRAINMSSTPLFYIETSGTINNSPPPLSYADTNRKMQLNDSMNRSPPPFSQCTSAYVPASHKSSQDLKYCNSSPMDICGPNATTFQRSASPFHGPNALHNKRNGAQNQRNIDFSNTSPLHGSDVNHLKRNADFPNAFNGPNSVSLQGPNSVSLQGPNVPSQKIPVKRSTDFPVYVHPIVPVPSKVGVPTSYARATQKRTNNSIPRLNSFKTMLMKDKPQSSKICGFCTQNGERKEVFRSHNKADADGKVICPYLASHVCETCGATGQNAHTKTYCPKLPKKEMPLPVALKSTPRKSDGKLRK